MLGDAMIADRGYAVPETRTIRLRAKTHFNDLPSEESGIRQMLCLLECRIVGRSPGNLPFNENSCGRRSRLNSRGFARRSKETNAGCGHIGGLKLRSDDGG